MAGDRLGRDSEVMFSGRSDRTLTAGPSLDEVVHDQIADEAFHRYLEWRDECATVEAAYRNWSNACAADVTFAFAAFTAALEREEKAASQYKVLIEAGERLLAARRRRRRNRA